MNSLDATDFILGTKHFSILYDGVPITEIMDLKGEHVSTMVLCTLKDHMKCQFKFSFIDKK